MPTLIQAPTVAAEAPPQGATATPTPVIGWTVQGPMPDVPTLRSQVGELQIQLSGLQAQWDGLRSQLDAMLKNNPARPGVQQTWADVGVQIARVKGEIAYREARIAAAEGRISGTTAPPPGLFRRPVDPNVVFPMAGVMLMVLALPVSFAWARRIFRGKPQPAPVPIDHSMRLEHIEQAIDAIAIEVERVSEGQRYVTKILTERRDQASRAESAEASDSAPKMLGAGPVEPVNIPQRERVHERIITPR